MVSGAAEAQVVTLRQTVKRVKQRSGDHDSGRTCSPGLPLLVYFQSVVPRREGWIKPGDGSLGPVVGEEGKEGETQSHKDERTSPAVCQCAHLKQNSASKGTPQIRPAG